MKSTPATKEDTLLAALMMMTFSLVIGLLALVPASDPQSHPSTIAMPWPPMQAEAMP